MAPQRLGVGKNRSGPLPIEVADARHDVIERLRLHIKEVDQGPDGDRQCLDGTVSTYTSRLGKCQNAARRWYLRGTDGNDATPHTGRSFTSPRARPTNVLATYVADIETALAEKHPVQLALSNSLGRLQCDLVKPEHKKDAEKSHHNQVYVKEKRRLDLEGKVCKCDECEAFPLGHPMRDILLMDIDHDGLLGPILKAYYDNLNPSEIRDQKVMDAQHRVFALRCDGGHVKKERSRISLIAAKELPNINAAGTHTHCAQGLVTKYQALVAATLVRTNGQCPSSGVTIHEKNTQILHWHHPTGQRPALVTRGADKAALVVDMGKHNSVGNIGRDSWNSNYAQLLSREMAVSFPMIGKHHELFHIMEKRRVICEQNGAEFPWTESNGCLVISLKDVPELEVVLGDLSDKEIEKFAGVEIAKWDEDGQLLNAPKPPVKKKPNSIGSVSSVSPEQPASSCESDSSPSHIGDIQKRLQRSMGDDELSDEQRRETMTDSLCLLGDPSLRLQSPLARFLFDQVREYGSLTNILARLSRHDDLYVANQASAAIGNLLLSANRSREPQISRSLVDVVAKELVPQTSRERMEAELLYWKARKEATARHIAEANERKAASEKRMRETAVAPLKIDHSLYEPQAKQQRPLGRIDITANDLAPSLTLASGAVTSQSGGLSFSVTLCNDFRFQFQLQCSDPPQAVEIDGMMPSSLEQNLESVPAHKLDAFIDKKVEQGNWLIIAAKIRVERSESDSDRKACRAFCKEHHDRVASVRITGGLYVFFVGPDLQQQCRCLEGKTSRSGCVMAVVLKLQNRK